MAELGTDMSEQSPKILTSVQSNLPTSSPGEWFSAPYVGSDEVWRRWRAGESISGIARAVETPPQHVQRFFAQTGGVRPPSRQRRVQHLTIAEREAAWPIELPRPISTHISVRDDRNQRSWPCIRCCRPGRGKAHRVLVTATDRGLVAPNVPC